MIQKALKHFKELDDMHLMYKMPNATLYIDEHYTSASYLSISLYDIRFNIFYTVNYDIDTLEPIFVEKEIGFEPKTIRDLTESEMETIKTNERMIIGFIEHYDPTYQILDEQKDIERYEKQMNEQIKSYENAMKKSEKNIEIYLTGLKF